MLNAAIRGKIPEPFEFMWVHKDGTTRWGEAHIGLMKTGAKMTGFQAILLDITERKRTERLLRIQHDLAIALSETSGLTEALDRLLEAALQIEGIDSGGVYLVVQNTGAIELVAHEKFVSPVCGDGLTLRRRCTADPACDGWRACLSVLSRCFDHNRRENSSEREPTRPGRRSGHA